MMTEEEKMQMLREVLGSGAKIGQLFMDNHGEVTYNDYGDTPQEEQRMMQSRARDMIIEYVGRLMPVVVTDFRERFLKIWLEILEQDAVSQVVYDRGRQQGTLFNRNLVAQISHMMVGGLIIKNTSDVRMAELLEPEKGRNHPVRGALSVSPEDKRVKKAVNEVLEKHGVKVK